MPLKIPTETLKKLQPKLRMIADGDTRVNIEAARYAARNISTAKLVELPGADHLLWVGNTDSVADAAEEFLTGSRATVDLDRVLATVLVTDIVESTRRVAELGDRDWRSLLDQHDAIVRRELSRFRGQEVKTLGDGFMARFDGPARAVRCAMSIAGAARSLNIEVRAGVHTGEIEYKDADIGGIAVHLAARVAAAARGGEVLASQTVRDLVAGSNINFLDRGAHRLKGLPRAVRLFAVAPETEEPAVTNHRTSGV